VTLISTHALDAAYVASSGGQRYFNPRSAVLVRVRSVPWPIDLDSAVTLPKFTGFQATQTFPSGGMERMPDAMLVRMVKEAGNNNQSSSHIGRRPQAVRKQRLFGQQSSSP